MYNTTKESVDHYAQEFCVLFYKAYHYAQQENIEAEKLGQLVFVD